MSTLRVALVGCGTVGSEVARLLQSDGEELAARAGAKLELAGVAVRRPDKPRLGINPALVTADAEALVTSPDVDIVVEVVGGLEPAGELIRTALRAGKGVVSANKALLAEEGPALHALATEHGADLYYEASVAGAIPLLRPLRESLAGDRVVRVLGVVNGTTNFILDEMDTHGSSFADALADAQSLGYAEADPTADVEGYDAAAKAAILASIAFHTPVGTADVHREGITAVHASDVSSAR
ncbi:MAG TPA: homoserine dehydrogenase, partial [Jiangellaceae bacterium]|nr:homoserine dehydrogenase [Jiangellaceae bacterium]